MALDSHLALRTVDRCCCGWQYFQLSSQFWCTSWTCCPTILHVNGQYYLPHRTIFLQTIAHSFLPFEQPLSAHDARRRTNVQIDSIINDLSQTFLFDDVDFGIHTWTQSSRVQLRIVQAVLDLITVNLIIFTSVILPRHCLDTVHCTVCWFYFKKFIRFEQRKIGKIWFWSFYDDLFFNIILIICFLIDITLFQ